MRLLLCSEGFRTPSTVQACVELVGKPQHEISVAVVNEAYAHEKGDKRWVLNNLNDVAGNFPAELDMVNLLALSLEAVRDRLMRKDVIFVVGGNADYQMHLFQKTGFAALLPGLLESKVYVGSSAGSMVLGHKIPDAYHTVYGERHSFGVTQYMGMVPFAVMPHMDSPDWPQNCPDVLDGLARDTDVPLYGLQDDSAIVIDGDAVRFVGKGVYRARA